MKYRILIILLLGIACTMPAQKSRVIAVMQMIDAGKYSDAKEDIQLAVSHEKTSGWYRTYYAKGLLCQTAYEDGIKTSDTKKTTLYPDQLMVAYTAYEKALELDVRERLHAGIAQKYYHLSNDFRKLGEEKYKGGAYKDALRAFESALLISQSDLITAKTDTNLVYNTAMAAFESKQWDKAIGYLTGLHDDAYSSNASLLLAKACMELGDSVRAEELMKEGLERYKYQEAMVMYMVNRYVENTRMEEALCTLDSAIEAAPGNYNFHWARGLVCRRMDNYEDAIFSFKKAVELAPDKALLYDHLGISYYNIGIDLRESALNIMDNLQYQQAREAYMGKFREALKWLERSYELDPENEETIARLYQLYEQLQMKEKQEAFEFRMRTIR